MNSLPEETEAKPMKHLFVFKLGDNEFAVDLSCVREVHMPLEIFPVPCAAPFILGVVNLRGRAVAVVDLKGRLGIGFHSGGEMRMVVAEAAGREFIFAIDSQGESLLVHEDAIQQPPPNLSDKFQQYAKGILLIDGRTIVIIELQPSE